MYLLEFFSKYLYSSVLHGKVTELKVITIGVALLYPTYCTLTYIAISKNLDLFLI